MNKYSKSIVRLYQLFRNRKQSWKTAKPLKFKKLHENLKIKNSVTKKVLRVPPTVAQKSICIYKPYLLKIKKYN